MRISIGKAACLLVAASILGPTSAARAQNSPYMPRGPGQPSSPLRSPYMPRGPAPQSATKGSNYPAVPARAPASSTPSVPPAPLPSSAAPPISQPSAAPVSRAPLAPAEPARIPATTLPFAMMPSTVVPATSVTAPHPAVPAEPVTQVEVPTATAGTPAVPAPVPAGIEARPVDGQTLLMDFKVRLAWMADRQTCFCPLRAHATPIALVVSGTVPTHALRAQALKVAAEHCSVPVKDALTVVPGPEPQPSMVGPETLQRAAHAALNNGLASVIFELRVVASAEGMVTVSGMVPSYEEKLAVSERLRQVPGCACVNNRLSLWTITNEGKSYTLVTADGRCMVPTAGAEENTAPPTPLLGAGSVPSPAGTLPGSSTASHSAIPLSSGEHRPTVTAPPTKAPVVVAMPAPSDTNRFTNWFKNLRQRPHASSQEITAAKSTPVAVATTVAPPRAKTPTCLWAPGQSRTHSPLKPVEPIPLAPALSTGSALKSPTVPPVLTRGTTVAAATPEFKQTLPPAATSMPAQPRTPSPYGAVGVSMTQVVKPGPITPVELPARTPRNILSSEKSPLSTPAHFPTLPAAATEKAAHKPALPMPSAPEQHGSVSPTSAFEAPPKVSTMAVQGPVSAASAPKPIVAPVPHSLPVPVQHSLPPASTPAPSTLQETARVPSQMPAGPSQLTGVSPGKLPVATLPATVPEAITTRPLATPAASNAAARPPLRRRPGARIAGTPITPKAPATTVVPAPSKPSAPPTPPAPAMLPPTATSMIPAVGASPVAPRQVGAASAGLVSPQRQLAPPAPASAPTVKLHAPVAVPWPSTTPTLAATTPPRPTPETSHIVPINHVEATQWLPRDVPLTNVGQAPSPTTTIPRKLAANASETLPAVTPIADTPRVPAALAYSSAVQRALYLEKPSRTDHVILVGAQASQGAAAGSSMQRTLKQRIEKECGADAADIQLAIRSASSLLVSFKARDALTAQRLADRVLKLPELGPYQVSLNVQVAQ